MRFAAKHAEAIFVVFPNTTVCRAYCDRIRELAAEYGRDPRHLKILTAIAPVVGTTDAEARRKHQEMLEYASPEGAFALFGGCTGIDLSKYGPGDGIEEVQSEGMQFLAQYFSSVDSTRERTMREIAEFLSIASVIPVPVGDYRRIADEFERWIVEGGVNGFNFFSIDSPVDYTTFVDLVVPELQRRGLLRKEYEASTLREHYFGKGPPRLANDHPGAAYSVYRIAPPLFNVARPRHRVEQAFILTMARVDYGELVGPKRTGRRSAYHAPFRPSPRSPFE
jgi:hypothetical protein